MENRFACLAGAFLNTPPLWTKSQFGMDQFEMPAIDLSRLAEADIPPRLRLGHKMERVLHALLEAQKIYEVVDRNVVIKRDKKTLGEMDYLLSDSRNGQTIHLELTYKFYLIDTEISEPIYRLVGPNRRDMFYTKLEKLKEGQLALPFTAEGRYAIQKRRLDPDKLIQRVCFKAQLFTSFESRTFGIRPLNPNCVVGSWMRLDNFQTGEFNRDEYYLPTKEEWISMPCDHGDYVSYYTALIELNLRMLKQSSTLVWRKKREGSFDKFFVVWW
jgi:hypothetical protein